MKNIQRIYISGTSRGLGFQLVKLIYKNNPNAELHISSLDKPGLQINKWEEEQGMRGINCYKLDLNDYSSISRNVELIKRRGFKLDFIVANAAVGCDRGQTIPSLEVARSTLKTNVTDNIHFIKQFLPILSDEGRIVIVSSIMGALCEQSKTVQTLLNDPNVTEEQILTFVDRYIHGVETKDMTDLNWSAYRTSKALLNAWARFHLPHYLKAGQTAIALHPGKCKTAMADRKASLTSQQGAQRIYEGITIKEATTSLFYNTKYCDYINCQ